MELARYRPDPAVRWLQIDAEQTKAAAGERGRQAFARKGEFRKNVRDAAAAAVKFGQSVITENRFDQLDGSEYVLQTEHLDVVRGHTIRTIRYTEIHRVVMGKEAATLIMEAGDFVIRPLAHLSSGRVRVPIGWQRNGIDVPFEILVEEIAARAGKRLEIEA